MKDFGEHEFLDERTYEEIYRQVRECVDLCHRDGVIKDGARRRQGKCLGRVMPGAKTKFLCRA